MNQLILFFAAFVFGTVIGSFLNVVIWRLPQSKSLSGRSKCPHCDFVLKPSNLVPLLSYLWQKGRCAQCRRAISLRYPVIEGITGLLFAAAALYALSGSLNSASILELLRLLFIIAVLIVVFVIDLEHYLILDVVVLPAALVVLLLNAALDVATHQPLLILSSYTGGGIVACVLASGFFYFLWRWSRGRWMGFGDVKFNLFLGLALGWPGIAVGLFLAFMLGSLIGLSLIALGQKQLQSRVPFGTFLSVGAILGLFYGPQLASWYAQLIGWR